MVEDYCTPIAETVYCECQSITHLIRFSYFPLKKEEIGTEDDIIYVSIFASNYLTDILPPLRFWKIDEWRYYFYRNYFKRFYHILRYLFNSSLCKPDEGVLDVITISNNLVLDKLYSFLNKKYPHETVLENTPVSLMGDAKEEWELKFISKQFIEEFPFEICTNFHFLKKNFLQRLKLSLKYLFCSSYSEKEFLMKKADAYKFKNLIKWTQKQNEEFKKEEKNGTK